MTVTRTQWKETRGSNGAFSVTLDSQPVQNSLILVTLIHRVGVTDGTAAVTNFTKIFERNVELADATYRRGIAQFYKIAGASESTIISGSWTNAESGCQILAEVFSPKTWEYLTFSANDNGAVSNATSIASGSTASTAAVDKMLFGTAGVKVGTQNQFTDLSIYSNDPIQTSTTIYSSALIGTDYSLDATSGTKSVSMSWTQPNDNLGVIGSLVVFGYSEETRKITISDLKDPNAANSAIANATGVQVKLWVSNDLNDPIDTGAPDVLVTDATITGGTMEVTFGTSASVGNPVLGVAKWTVTGTDYFFPIETTVQAIV